MPKILPVHRSRINEPSDARTPIQTDGDAVRSSKVASVTSPGPRKLIRPRVPAMTREDERNLRRPAVLTAQEVRGGIGLASFVHDPSNAEMYYLRKQVQDQTPMVFVLDDGEQIEGYIEWYDRDAIKVRNGTRTLVYKSSIKYLYKGREKPERTV